VLVLLHRVVQVGREADVPPRRGRPRPHRDLHLPLPQPEVQRVLAWLLPRRWKRQPQRGERSDHRIGARDLEVQTLAEHGARLQRQRPVARHDGGPSAVHHPAHVLDGEGQGAPRGQVTGARPVKFRAEAGLPVLQGQRQAVADRQRMQALLPVLAHVQHRAPFRRAQPLVRVRRGPRGPDGVEVERDRADAVGRIEQHRDAPSFERRHKVLEGHPQPRRAGDSVDHRKHRPVRHGGEHPLEDDLGPVNRERQRHRHDRGAPAVRDHVDGVPAGLVGVVGDEDLVARGQPHGAQHGVHARGGVVNQGEVVRIAAKHPGQHTPRRVHPLKAFPVEEGDRVRFHAVPPALLFGEHRGWRRAKGAVVQENDGGVKRPVPGVRARRPRDHAPVQQRLGFVLSKEGRDRAGRKGDRQPHATPCTAPFLVRP
jgi:hypothetical protein